MCNCVYQLGHLEAVAREAQSKPVMAENQSGPGAAFITAEAVCVAAETVSVTEEPTEEPTEGPTEEPTEAPVTEPKLMQRA